MQCPPVAPLKRTRPTSRVRRAACAALAMLSLGYFAPASAQPVMLSATPTAVSPPPGNGRTMTFEEARHLLNRTSFAAQVDEIDAFTRLSRAEAVDRLLADTRRQAAYPPPAWALKYERAFRPNMTTEERQQANRREQVERGLELRTWWVAEMLSTPSPLTEKLTLFWHNHFATSQAKVRSAALMYQQNVLLRLYATGNFGAMLREVSKNPAMLIYLDGAQNRKGAPNENFAREVMELFTLGEGQYSEQDIKEVARAFTGWSIDADLGEFRFRRAQHDDGVKRIFGQEGRFNGDDVITLLLQRPATSEFVVKKLWREFVSDMPSPQTVRELASLWRASNYEMKPLLRAMLLSEAFWAPANRGTLVKSPVDLVIGSLRQFQFSVEDPAPFAVILRQLGQDLFAPPNVKGWPPGETWLNTTTLLARKGFLNRLFRADEMLKPDGATASAQAAPQPTAQLIDRDMMGDGRARAQTRLAVRSGREANQQNRMEAAMPPFGVSNQLRGQYFFSSDQWFAKIPQQGGADKVWQTLLAGPPVQAAKDVPHTLAGLRAVALDPMYQLR